MPAIDDMIKNLSSFIGGAGALGIACFGIVEGLKWTSLGAAGFGQIKKFLGSALSGALRNAYGPEYEELLLAQYREDSQTQMTLAKTLRQGVRIGLTPENAHAIAEFLGTVGSAALGAAAANAAAGVDLSSADRAAIGRFEFAVDARIESALSKAKDVYLGTIRCTSALFAIVIAELVAPMLKADWSVALLLGVVAVPFAPIANDLIGALQAATKALKAR